MAEMAAEDQENSIDVRFGGSDSTILGKVDGEDVRVGIDHSGIGPNPEKFYGTVGGRDLSEGEAEELYSKLKPAAEAKPWKPTELPNI